MVAALQRLDRGHAAMDEAPHLPVRAEPVLLAVRADRDRDAAIGELLGLARGRRRRR